MIRPPADIAPAKLFRLLCATPRPMVALRVRFRFASDQQLFCRALHPREWLEWEDTDDDLETVVITNALCDEKGQPLLGRESVFLLTDAERETVFVECIDALNRIGPSYQRPPSIRCDIDAWQSALERGAEANPSITLSLGTIFEGGVDRLVSVPERYFNVPRAELLDGHWMAYRAAREVIEKHRKKK